MPGYARCTGRRGLSRRCAWLLACEHVRTSCAGMTVASRSTKSPLTSCWNHASRPRMPAATAAGASITCARASQPSTTSGCSRTISRRRPVECDGAAVQLAEAAGIDDRDRDAQRPQVVRPGAFAEEHDVGLHADVPRPPHEVVHDPLRAALDRPEGHPEQHAERAAHVAGQRTQATRGAQAAPIRSLRSMGASLRILHVAEAFGGWADGDGDRPRGGERGARPRCADRATEHAPRLPPRSAIASTRASSSAHLAVAAPNAGRPAAGRP